MGDLLRLLTVLTPTCRTCLVIVASSLASALALSLGRAMLLIVAVALGGCAALPSHAERPVSYAREASGFRLLPDGGQGFDARLALVRRSAEWNTELDLVVDSAGLAQDVARLIGRERLPSSHRLRVASAGGAIEWISGSGAGEVVRDSEAGADAAQMLQLWITSRFVGADLL